VICGGLSWRVGRVPAGGEALTAIAAEASVAIQTVYKVFGSEQALLSALVDVTVAGDDEPVALLRPASFGRSTTSTPRRTRCGWPWMCETTTGSCANTAGRPNASSVGWFRDDVGCWGCNWAVVLTLFLMRRN
jgi:hypothetical protein